LDREFYDEILKLPSVDPCGEGGEYHTVITDGPSFTQKIILEATERKRLENGFGYLEIKKYRTVKK